MIQLPDRWLKGHAREQALLEFSNLIRSLSAQVGFKVSSRGWCYILEEHGLRKGDFNRAQKVINDCRKNGYLPVDFTAEDKARNTDHIESLDDDDPDSYANYLVNYMFENYIGWWEPKSFWENQKYYVEVAVEKVDLVTLFKPACLQYNVPITNFRGWSDINSRAKMMNRFQERQDEGKECVLLYCGDHDPGGLNISQAIRQNMEQLAEADGIDGWWPDEVNIVRFGLNYDFIQENNLSWIDNLETASGKNLASPRHRDHYKHYVQNYLSQYGARKVEANALVTRPDAGRRLMRETLEKYIDLEAMGEWEEQVGDLRDQLETNVMELLEEKFGE
jgi:hypothetical protein